GPETKDSEFTWADFQTRNNSELVGIYGNFVNRVAVLIQKYFEGKVPEAGTLEDIDQHVLKEMAAYPGKIAQAIERYHFREATALIMDLARMGNKSLADTQPWHLIKTSPERVATILNIATQLTVALSIVSEPVTPFTAARILTSFCYINHCLADAGNFDLTPPHTERVLSVELVEKIDDKGIQAENDRRHRANDINLLEKHAVPSLNPECVYD